LLITLVLLSLAVTGCSENPVIATDDLFRPDSAGDLSMDLAVADQLNDSLRPDQYLPSTSWAVSLGGPSMEEVTGIAADKAGNAYATGWFMGATKIGKHSLTANGSPDTFVVMLDTKGSAKWIQQAGNVMASTQATGVAVDSQRNTYVTGWYGSTTVIGTTTLNAKGSNEVFVARLDSTGQPQWAVSAGGKGYDTGRGISTDGAGNCYVTGTTSKTARFGSTTLTSNGGWDVFVMKLSSAGKVQWARAMGGPEADMGWDVAADTSGNSYVTGFFKKTAVFGQVTLTSKGQWGAFFVARLNSAGKVLWAVAGDGVTGGGEGHGIAVDGSGNCYVTGYLFGTTTFGQTTLVSKGAGDVFVAKLNSAGGVVWATAAVEGPSNDHGNGIAVDSAGNSHVTGVGGPGQAGKHTLTNGGAFALKLSSAGEVLWATVAKTSGIGNYTRGTSIAVDASGGTYVAGRFNGTAKFGTTTLTSQKLGDGFVWRLK